MLEIHRVLVYVYGFYALLTVAGIAMIVKAVDWLIGQKYVSHDKCERCRSEIYKTIALDHDLLKDIHGKVDLIIQGLDIKIGE